MGVPKFYRWISERYPCLSEVVKENQIPEFDNLYLDMNGIIHPCSHPNDDDVHFRITEEKIYENIFQYIEVLFRIIRPRKVFFMAVDGVAPRAKMNQQRGRRFRSANEAEAREKEAIRKGETLPEEKRFDSNCITPGTHFMARLNEQLKYFVNQKMTHDKSWQGIRVFLSGHETPGEGEHKIMDFIRSEKLRTDYDPNTRHCLYGLDADLMMLGLASHEPHFSLLREEVRFGKQANSKRPTTAEETTFHLLHLSLFREYLDAEFSSLRAKVSNYDAEKIIDDWVFMGFLVGNDFVPHLPDLHINHNALPLLYQTYIEVRSQMDGYINENGTLNLRNFEIYITKLGQYDRDKFEEQFVDLSYFSGKKDNSTGEAWQSERVNAKKEAEQRAKNLDNSFAALMGLEEDPDWPDSPSTPGAAVPANIPAQQDGDNEEDEEEDQFEVEFRQHKADYYRTKFGVENITKSQLFVIVKEYVRAMQWILHYYFNGIQSWGWYYPYHYAPYMSDLKDFSYLQLEFDKGEPFLPFQQLLGVLPAASRECLPDTYQSLMIMDNSPIIDYYPVEFEQDLNGKQQAWEAVVLIPFIDEKRLLDAMAPRDQHLTEEERGRNKHSPHLCYTYDETLNFKYPSSCVGHFPDIVACRARCKEIHKMAFQHDPSKLQRGLRKGVKLGVYFPGFPTFHHLEYTTELSKQEVKVFQQNSRAENMMINVISKNVDTYELDAAAVANDLLGKSIYAHWPHLKEVRVIAVAAAKDEYRYELVDSVQKGSKATEQRTIKRVPILEDDRIQWIRDVKHITETYHKRKGVRIGRTEIIVYACPLMGRRYICGHSGVITLEKQWSSNPVPYAYQVTIKDIAVHDSSFKQFKTLAEIFPKDSECFMLGTPNYGCEGKVQEVEDGRVRVIFTIPYEPTFEHIKRNMDQYETQYFPGYILAKRLGVSSHLVSRITGTIFMERGSKEDCKVPPKVITETKDSIYKPGLGNRIAIGLNLKFNKSNQEIPGYTKKEERGDKSTWLYSTKLEDTLRDYIQMFPELFAFISKKVSEETYYEADIFGEDTQRLKDLQDWIKSLDCSKAGKVDSGHKNISETAVKLIEEDLCRMVEAKKKGVRKMKMFVRPHLLYRPLDDQGNLIPDPEAEYQLFDRVVNVREGYTVPLGLKGIVIGIQQSVNVLDSLYDVIFDEEFPGGLSIRCKGSCAYRVPPTAVINISFGLRRESGQHRSDKPTAVVKPQFSAYSQSQYTQSPAWYSNTMGKLGSPNDQGGQRSRGPANAKASSNQYTPRNQRSSGRPSVEASPETFYTPKTQVETTPYSTPYQSPPPKSSSQSDHSYGKNIPHRQNQQDSPMFTLLTKKGLKKVGQPTTKEDIQAIATPKQGSKSATRPAPTENIRPVIEGSSNYASILKGGSKTPNESKKTEPAANQKQENVKGQRSQRGQLKETVTAEVDEFANLWKQLQASDSENSTPNTPARNKAALPEESNVDQSMQMNTSDIPIKPKSVTNLMLNEEERMSPRSYAKSGTEELCRILNITGISEEPKEDQIPTSESSVEESPKSDSDATPSYGVPLTLDELFSGVFPSKEPASPGPLPGSPQPPIPQHSIQQPIHQGQSTLPISIPASRPSHPFPMSPIPIHSHSSQTQPRHAHPGFIAGHPVAAPSGSPLTASSSGSSLPRGSPVSSTGSPAASGAIPLQVHGQPHMPISTQMSHSADPRTPPRTSMQPPVPGGSPYEGSPIQAQNIITSQQMLQGLRGPSLHQGPPQQFRMQGFSGPPASGLRGPPMVNRGPLPPNMFPGPTYTQMLHDWCWQKRMPRPQFEFFTNPKTGTIRAGVHLPNGPRFMGPDGVNQHAAADMAAHILLRQLEPAMRAPIPGHPPHGSPRQPPPTHGSPHQPPPTFGSPRQPPPTLGSPRQPAPTLGSPRQPLHPPHSLPGQTLPSHGSPIQRQQVPRYPVSPNQQMMPRPIRPTLGSTGVGTQWTGLPGSTAPTHLGSPLVAQGPLHGSPVSSSQTQVSAPQVVFHAHGTNPFVPLQVTRKLTPRKSTSQDEESDLPTSPRSDISATLPSSTDQATYNMATFQPTAMVTPPRNYAVSSPQEVHMDYPISQERKSHKVDEKKIVVEEEQGVTMEGGEDIMQKPMSRPRRKPSKAKLAINFGGN